MINREEDKIYHDIKEMTKTTKNIIRYTNKDYTTFTNGNPYDMS